MDALVVVVVMRWRRHVERLSVEHHVRGLLLRLVRSQVLREASLQFAQAMTNDSSSFLQGGQSVNTACTASSVAVPLGKCSDARATDRLVLLHEQLGRLSSLRVEVNFSFTTTAIIICEGLL